MRELTSHKVNELNEAISIEVLDEPGAGNACHIYRLTVPIESFDADHLAFTLIFQNGPVAEVGTNGISNEALLAVIEDRLKGFQSGPYACRENDIALTKIQEAMHWLHHRTLERMERGIEGTSVV